MIRLIIIFLFANSFNSFSQQPIFATIGGGDLYSFDLPNCTRHFVGSTGYGFGDIAFTPNGKLWGIVGGELYQIDTSTANATLIGNTGIGAVSLVGLNDTTLLAEYDMKLYGLNINNAISYFIDTIGYQAAGDLTWYDDDLYMVTSGEQIIKMILNKTQTAIISTIPIGRSVPSCEGAVTTSFVGEYNSIVGFSGSDAIKICQIDGSSQMLCSNLNINGTPGAASLRLVSQVPEPTLCFVPTGLERFFSEYQFSIFPNPVVNKLNIKTEYLGEIYFRIYSTLGQLVMAGSFKKGTASIDVNDLVEGIYGIELANSKMERKCFIIKK